MDIIMKRHPVTGKERPQERDFDEAKRVVRVLPRNDEIRKYLKHPTTRVGFLAEGAAEWPNDQFTRRRIADGDISIERAAPVAAEAPMASEPPAPAESESRMDLPQPPVEQPGLKTRTKTQDKSSE